MTRDVAAEDPTAIVAALDPDRTRGGLTADQVAVLALRCGGAETQLRACQEAIGALMVEITELTDRASAANARVAVLEAALHRAAWGKPWILREVGL